MAKEQRIAKDQAETNGTIKLAEQTNARCEQELKRQAKEKQERKAKENQELERQKKEPWVSTNIRMVVAVAIIN